MTNGLDLSHYPLSVESLPKGWIATTIASFALSINTGFACGRHNSNGEGVPHLRPMNISPNGNIDLSDVRYVPAEYDARRLSVGDVLFNNTNSPMWVGKTATVDRPVELAFSNHMTVIRSPEAICPRFVARQLHYLQQCGYFLHKCKNHVNQASVNADILATSVPIRLAPEAEQVRIADRIEELFTDLDAGVAALVRVQKKLNRYRAALLHSAVTGRLTADWRAKHGDGGESGQQLLERILVARRQDWEQHTLAEYEANGRTPTKNWRDRYPEPSLPDTSSLAELPDSWVWASAAQLCSSIQNGNTPEAPMMSAGYGEVPFLKVYNLTKNGSLNFEKDPTYISMKTHSELLKRSICRPGDVLMNIVGPPLGKVSIVPDTHPEWNINQAIVAYRCLEGFSNRLLCSLLLTESVLRPLLNTSKATAGQFNISVNSSRSVAIPVPPVAEQEVLLGVLSEKVSNIESMEAEVDRGLRRAARLRQAILKAAFEGKLVPQNPNDEPASELLARIQAEADAGANSATKRAPSKRKTTKRKTNKKATT